jgi:hypothetical protein
MSSKKACRLLLVRMAARRENIFDIRDLLFTKQM